MPNVLARHAHWVLRASLIAVFAYHGLAKFTDNPEMQANMLGISVGLLLLTGLAELGGAVLILVGGFGSHLATRLGGAAIVPVMLGAIAKFHWPQWSFVASEAHPMGGMEFQLSLLAIGAFFIVTGNGASPQPRIRQSAQADEIAARI